MSTHNNVTDISVRILQTRLWLARRGVVACCGALLLATGGTAWFWHISNIKKQSVTEQVVALPKPNTTLAVVAQPTADQNLHNFYDTLGERHYAEQQLKVLFELAGKNGLILSKGQYKSAFEQNGRFYTYQITLPVKGSYLAIWQFATQTLTAIPFASLDEISFKRDSIADKLPEAQLRFTLYLNDSARKGLP